MEENIKTFRGITGEFEREICHLRFGEGWCLKCITSMFKKRESGKKKLHIANA
jgi:hypothetical protein